MEKEVSNVSEVAPEVNNETKKTEVNMDEVKEKVGKATQVIKEKASEVATKVGNALKLEEKEKVEPVVSSRILFISVLDKIYFIGLVLLFVVLTWINWQGDISSSYYNYGGRIWSQVVIMLIMAVVYLFCNWLYKCAAKTMLCVTPKGVYKETHYPFFKGERNIPANKITSIEAVDYFWIFRAVIVHQYGNLPLVFWTWTNHQFKDKADELMSTEYREVVNEYADKNIMSKKMISFMKYPAALLVLIILILGIVRLFSYTFNDVKHVPGEYKNDDSSISLYESGDCYVYGADNCTWTYKKKEVIVVTEDESYSYYDGWSTETETINFKFDKKEKTLTAERDGKEYTFTKVEE